MCYLQSSQLITLSHTNMLKMSHHTKWLEHKTPMHCNVCMNRLFLSIMLFQPLPLPRVDTLTGEWADYFETRRRKNPYYPPFTTTTPPLPSRHFEGLGRQAASNGGWESPRGGKGCAGRAQLRARSAYRREGVMTGLLWEGIWGGRRREREENWGERKSLGWEKSKRNI